MSKRGRFARICVGKIWVRDHWYKVEYEGLHIICGKCGCYDHLGKDCRMIKDLPEGMAETRSADQELTAVRLDKETCNGSSSYPLLSLTLTRCMVSACLLQERRNWKGMYESARPTWNINGKSNNSIEDADLGSTAGIVSSPSEKLDATSLSIQGTAQQLCLNWKVNPWRW
jgi:hypothetical protein